MKLRWFIKKPDYYARFDRYGECEGYTRSPNQPVLQYDSSYYDGGHWVDVPIVEEPDDFKYRND